MYRPKVSVIVPVYNADKYIAKCADSLFSQSLDDIEYIFINDCSPDNSIDVMSKVLVAYPNRKEQVKVPQNEVNIGVGQSRQRGIDEGNGEYIIHCDPDDWVELKMYETLYRMEILQKADFVICDYAAETPNSSLTRIQDIPTSKKELFHFIAINKIHCAFWNKLIHTSLAKNSELRKVSIYGRIFP